MTRAALALLIALSVGGCSSDLALSFQLGERTEVRMPLDPVETVARHVTVDVDMSRCPPAYGCEAVLDVQLGSLESPPVTVIPDDRGTPSRRICSESSGCGAGAQQGWFSELPCEAGICQTSFSIEASHADAAPGDEAVVSVFPRVWGWREAADDLEPEVDVQVRVE